MKEIVNNLEIHIDVCKLGTYLHIYKNNLSEQMSLKSTYLNVYI